MKKKSVKPSKLIDIQCPRCGRVTHHYLNELTGEYKCVICQSTNKTIKVKPKKEILFTADEDLEAELNPIENVIEEAEQAKLEKTS
jgi:uncharacterized Zn finger protein (UPF0148 family)